MRRETHASPQIHDVKQPSSPRLRPSFLCGEIPVWRGIRNPSDARKVPRKFIRARPEVEQGLTEDRAAERFIAMRVKEFDAPPRKANGRCNVPQSVEPCSAGGGVGKADGLGDSPRPEFFDQLIGSSWHVAVWGIEPSPPVPRLREAVLLSAKIFGRLHDLLRGCARCRIGVNRATKERTRPLDQLGRRVALDMTREKGAHSRRSTA